MDRTPAPWRALEEPVEVAPLEASPPAASADQVHRWIAIVAVGAAVALATSAWWLAATAGSASVVEPAILSSSAPGTASPTDAGTVGAIVVDVAGAVAHPGLVRLPAGSRVADAIQAAGGLAPRVDVGFATQALNLAARLRDGDQVRVPSRDDVGSSSSGGGGSAAGSARGAPSGRPTTPMNLNTATETELEALPGIGPATAAKIVAAREDRSFGSVDELRERKIVGRSTLAKIRDLVTVR